MPSYPAIPGYNSDALFRDALEAVLESIKVGTSILGRETGNNIQQLTGNVRAEACRWVCIMKYMCVAMCVYKVCIACNIEK